MNRKQIGVIGDSECNKSGECEFAEKLGEELGKLGVIVLSGGKGGIMEAVFRGAKKGGGLTVAILPSSEKSEANVFSDIVIPTGMGWTRNSIVALSSDLIIAIGGKSGTLSELAFSWMYGKPIIAVVGFGGWSEKLAGKKIDDRRDDFIYPCDSVECVIDVTRKALGLGTLV